MSFKKFISRYRLLLLLLLLIGVTFVTRELAIGIKVDALRNYFSSFGVLAPIVFIVVFGLTEIIPGGSSINSVLYYLAGFIFKPELAVAFTLIADLIGVTINFFIARFYGPPLLKNMLNKQQFLGLEHFTKTINWELVFLFRLIPFITTFGIDIVSYAAGLGEIDYVEFLLATLIPWAIINTIQFYSINHFVASSNALFLLPVYLILSIPLSIIILIKRPQYRKFFKQFYERIDILNRIIEKVKNIFH